MTENNPIIPPLKLVKQWMSAAAQAYEGDETWIDLATQAARWGADQELAACCEYFKQLKELEELYFARRPTTAQQACDALDTYIYGNPDHKDKERTYNTIRRALDKLKELEKDN